MLGFMHIRLVFIELTKMVFLNYSLLRLIRTKILWIFCTIYPLVISGLNYINLIECSCVRGPTLNYAGANYAEFTVNDY